MPSQGLTVLPEPPGSHVHHIGSNHTKKRTLRKWSNLLSIWRGQARMSLLVSSQRNSNKQNTVQLTSEKQGWRDSLATLIERYGKCREVVGRGNFGIMLISCKEKDAGAGEELYTVKKFQQQSRETERAYMKGSVAEFCIASALSHPNVIRTVDLLNDTKGDYCEVMEFCSGGDLHSLVRSVGKLQWQEADCFFKQMILGVKYIHEMGVAHLDLKPEHLLLPGDGLLKISGFGRSECVRLAWEKDIHMVSGIRESGPYIAPEEYTDEEFDGHAADIWACGVIYMAMITGFPLWRTAKKSEDVSYARYLMERRQQEGFVPIESLPRLYSRNTIYCILDPNPSRRITASHVLRSEWGREMKLCKVGQGS